MPVTSAFNHSAVNLGSTGTQTKEEKKNKKRMKSTTRKSRTFLGPGGVLRAILAVAKTNQYKNLMLSLYHNGTSLAASQRYTKIENYSFM